MAKLVPSPRAWPLIGTLGELVAAGGAAKLHEYVHRRHQQLGPIYREKIGPVTGVFVSNAEYMRKVFALEGRYPRHVIPESWALYNQIHGQQRGLLFMEGEEWHKYRKLLNGIILRPESGATAAAVSVAADDLINLWRHARPDNLERQLYRWSLQNIISILLGAESYTAHLQQTLQYLDPLSKCLHKIFVESAKLSLLPANFARKWNLPPWKRFENTVTNTFKIANELMEMIKDFPKDEGSILQQLQKSTMQPKDLNIIVIDLILAAGDTTAYTTQWMLYLLSQHEDIQERLYQEVKGENMQVIYENPLVRSLIRETLRLYPVAPFVTRYMPDDVEIDGYPLKKGDMVIMSLYTSGRDETCFPQPLEFQPDRWIREGGSYKNVTNPQGSMPFAMGARSCIGRKMAEIQIGTAIAKISKTFKIYPNNKNKIDIKLNLIAVPSEPISIVFKLRH